MNIPSPSKVGLPEKFSQWRTKQEEAISFLLSNTKRVKAICSPTGSGKSISVVAAALLSKTPTAIVTATKGLMAQYQKDFSSIGLVSLLGRSNYKCGLRPDDPSYSCEEGRAVRCPYIGTVACHLSQAEMRVRTSSLVVTDYAKWCMYGRYRTCLEHINQVIFDEGHHMPEALAEAMQIVLHHSEVEDGLKLDFLGGHEAEDMMYWKGWAVNARATAEIAMIAAQARITGMSNPKPTWVRHFLHMRSLVRKLAILATCNPNDWVVEQATDGYQFDPIRPGKYAEVGLLLHTPKVMVVSATLRPKTMYMTGIGRDKFDFAEFDSDFDPRRSPIYYVPTQRVDYRNQDLTLLWMRLDQIASARKTRSGIVHTVSYARQEQLKAVSRHAHRMIVNLKGEAPMPLVEQFKRTPGSILVSPAVGTGYDFPDDECRWQLMCKVPFEPPSKIQKARQADDKEYVAARAMQYLIQAFGRDMRGKSDWSERFIGDDHWDWFQPKYAHLAPRSFHAVTKTVQVLPPPLNPAKL